MLWNVFTAVKGGDFCSRSAHNIKCAIWSKMRDSSIFVSPLVKVFPNTPFSNSTFLIHTVHAQTANIMLTRQHQGTFHVSKFSLKSWAYTFPSSQRKAAGFQQPKSTARLICCGSLWMSKQPKISLAFSLATGVTENIYPPFHIFCEPSSGRSLLTQVEHRLQFLRAVAGFISHGTALKHW